MSINKHPPRNLDDLPASALLTIREVAEILNVVDLTVRRWSASGRLPKLRKIGPNSTRINAGELREALSKLAA